MSAFNVESSRPARVSPIVSTSSNEASRTIEAAPRTRVTHADDGVSLLAPKRAHGPGHGDHTLPLRPGDDGHRGGHTLPLRPGEDGHVGGHTLPNRPHAPNHHFGLDPGTGEIEQRPDIDDLLWTSEDQRNADRGWHYGIDPGTGEVEHQPNVDNLLWTSEDQKIADRGWHYGVDPETGEVERQGNIQLL